jgi:hypothetical protein
MAIDPAIAARRKAQRTLAKQIKEGTYKPSSIGAPSRKVSGARTKLINAIYAEKKKQFGDRPKWNAKRARASIIKNDKTGKTINTETLQRVLDKLQDTKKQIDEDYYDDAADIDAAGHYH